MKNKLSATLSWLTTALIAASFVGLTYADFLPSRITLWAVPVLFGVVSLIAAGAAFAVNHRGGWVAALLGAATPLLFVSASLGAFVVVHGYWTRWCVGVAGTLLTSLYLAYWRGIGRGDERFREDDFAHLTLAVHVFLTFFVMVTSFGVKEYLPVPVPVAAVVVGLISFITGAETLRRSRVAGSFVVPVALLLAVVMAESYVAIAQLPTTNLVGGLVGAVTYAATLYASLSALGAAQLSHRLGRHLTFSLAMIFLVLSTARWA